MIKIGRAPGDKESLTLTLKFNNGSEIRELNMFL